MSRVFYETLKVKFMNISRTNHDFKDFSRTTYNSRTIQGTHEPLATLVLQFYHFWVFHHFVHENKFLLSNYVFVFFGLFH